MKLTTQILKKIIKEELSGLREGDEAADRDQLARRDRLGAFQALKDAAAALGPRGQHPDFVAAIDKALATAASGHGSAGNQARLDIAAALAMLLPGSEPESSGEL